MSPQSLDKWAIDTNGSPLPDEQKEEIGEYMDVNDEGNLTSVFPKFLKTTSLAPRIPSRFKGFTQIYQLQTVNDESETWRDLVRQLQPFTQNQADIPLGEARIRSYSIFSITCLQVVISSCKIEHRAVTTNSLLLEVVSRNET
jgi:hypothetical protein